MRVESEAGGEEGRGGGASFEKGRVSVGVWDGVDGGEEGKSEEGVAGGGEGRYESIGEKSGRRARRVEEEGERI